VVVLHSCGGPAQLCGVTHEKLGAVESAITEHLTANPGKVEKSCDVILGLQASEDDLLDQPQVASWDEVERQIMAMLACGRFPKQNRPNVFDGRIKGA